MNEKYVANLSTALAFL